MAKLRQTILAALRDKRGQFEEVRRKDLFDDAAPVPERHVQKAFRGPSS